MKKSFFKLTLISSCFAFTVVACSSNKDTSGNSDSDSTMVGPNGTGMDTVMTDTTGMGTGGIGTGTGTDGSGATVPEEPDRVQELVVLVELVQDLAVAPTPAAVQEQLRDHSFLFHNSACFA